MHSQQADTATRAVGAWLALAAIILAVSLAFHGPIAPDHGVQMQRIADGTLRWLVVHWAAALALSFFAIASLIALTASARFTRNGWTRSAWALLPVGALWTATTAVAEATVIYHAAVAGERAVYDSWWMFAEGNANGFAAMTLAFAVIAANEARSEEGRTPLWATVIAIAAGLLSVTGWVLGMWFGLSFGAPLWVAGAIIICLWLIWFGLSLVRHAADGPDIRRNAPTGV